MRRSAWIAGLVVSIFFSTGRCADASKVEISISQAQWSSYGYLNGSSWARGAELVDGKLPDMTTERDWNADWFFPDRSKTWLGLGGPLNYVLTVTEWVPDENGESYSGRNIARGTLTGTSTGGITNFRLDGYRASGSGTATVSDLVINNPSLAPDWLRDLRVNLEIKPGDEGSGSYTTVLTVTLDTPVPEPGSAIVFLAAAGAGLSMHRRRRDRANAM